MILEVGQIGRAHGLKGEVLVNLTTDLVSERTAPGAVFFVPGGETLEVERAQAHQGKWRVKFLGVDSRSAAEKLAGTKLEAEALEDVAGPLVHELVGKVVVDAEGTERGEVTALISNPASDILELDTGHLVPLAFYVSHDSEKVHVAVPDGLWDL